LGLILFSVGALLSCQRSGASPQVEFAKVNLSFIHGNLQQSQESAARDAKRFERSNREWARKFQVLQAKAAAWSGSYREVLKILDSGPPASDPETLISELSLRGVANAYTYNFAQAEGFIAKAAELCQSKQLPSCGEMMLSRGLLASQQKQYADAISWYESSLEVARLHEDPFLESWALLNLGDEYLSREHFDEAIDFSESAVRVASSQKAAIVELTAQANIGWARYKLGDSEGALAIFLDAEKRASAYGDFSDQENELTNIGYISMDQGRLTEARQSFLQALTLAKQLNGSEDIYHALRVLARVSLQLGEVDEATEFAEKALSTARQITVSNHGGNAAGNHEDELYPQLVLGQIAAKRKDFTNAEATLRQVEQDKFCPLFLKWEAEHSLARLYEDQSLPERADRQYRDALATFEGARSSVRREDYQISFLANGERLYDDYVQFLVTHQRNEDALEWADFSRARTLAEGLGVSDSGFRRTSADSGIVPRKVDARGVARKAGGTILFYWLGEKQSYLWAATSSTTQLYLLPSRTTIEGQVRRYRAAVTGPQNVLDSGNEDGKTLYQTLIAPASNLLQPNSKIFIIPDGSLANLNFETLIVPAEKPHYWIEDAVIVASSSLRILGSAPTGKITARKRLLLVGNSVAVSSDYPELPRAADQMASVSKHFPQGEQRVFQRERATPEAYLGNNPEQFSNIHFVAHGIGSRLSPLDSAIVLSKEDGNPGNFKLYARDIIHHRLKADLVTISACYGAGERHYSGEGLVGLAWAFLRAGSRNVIAALWDVEDSSTDQLMNRFYDELAKGSQPETALRNAKLWLLKGGTFRSPFYWAPFQLYRG
jgi:CHAT domain-containing protein/Tfp pilus assembly protein PilF